jgi:hypothetical protein
MSDDLSWDISAVQTRVCDIATATATQEAVVLHFGTRAPDPLQVQAFGAELLTRIALRPASARHLRDMLAQAVPTPMAKRGGTP